MSTFTGQLSVIGRQSNLDDGGTDWLIRKSGISDPTQATFAATQFLLKTKKLQSGQMINVEGESDPIGSVSVISMTDASASTSEAAHNEAIALAAPSSRPVAAPSGKKNKKKKPTGASKSVKRDAKKAGGGKSSGK